jgi:N-acetylmuramoyl-L-alanine amidase
MITGRLSGPVVALSLLVAWSVGMLEAQGQAGDTRRRATETVPGVPAMPAVRGDLELSVVYPKWRDLVDAPDTNFIFGSTGNGDASLTVNGNSVPVWPNGAWFAWIPFPQDSLMEFHLEASVGDQRAELTYLAQRASRFIPPDRPAWIDSTAVTPRGRVWWPAGDEVPITVRAAPGASVRIVFDDGTVLPLVADAAPGTVPWGVRAFGRDDAKLVRGTDESRYVGVLMARNLGPHPGPLVPDRACSHSAGECPFDQPPVASATIEAVNGGDTARVRWSLQVGVLEGPPLVVSLDDDPEEEGNTDGRTIGRAAPGATFHWFFPRGTRAAVSGRINDVLRLQLSRHASAWVPADEARPLARGIPRPSGRVGFLTLAPEEDRVVARIPVGQRLPFRVEESETSLRIRFYGATGDPNWIRYGGLDQLVARVDWRQDRSDELLLEFVLSRPVWGYRSHWDGNDLLLEIRRPPTVDPDNPLRGRFIVVDPGHPPAGARGPTGLREAEANLAVALRLRELLEGDGARVLMTRVSDSSVGLWPRIQLADSVDAELLISIHNNALPDGVNPFLANGSSVFYFHPRSVPLAREIQRGFQRRLQLRDLGVARGNLALTRPTWMPAVLTEGLHIMMPDHEAVLRTAEGQQLYALAVRDGIAGFLRNGAR